MWFINKSDESLHLIACNWAWGHKTLKDGKTWEIVHWLYIKKFWIYQLH